MSRHDRHDRHDPHDPHGGQRDARRGAHAAGLVGLAARGVMYLVLAVLAIQLLTQGGGRDVDTRGALHELAHHGAGPVVLVILALGFAAFAIWHVYAALVLDGRSRRRGRQAADAGRSVVYGALAALAVTYLTTAKRTGNSDQTDRTWTGHVLHWPAGRVLVVAIGLGILVGAGYLFWRAVSGDRHDEPAVLDAAPHETRTIEVLGRVGNVARAAVVALIGAFLVDAAIESDPNKTVGLDGALKRVLDQSYGDVLIVLVALGFAAFGAYSIARAWVNRGAPVTGRKPVASV